MGGACRIGPLRVCALLIFGFMQCIMLADLFLVLQCRSSALNYKLAVCRLKG